MLLDRCQKEFEDSFLQSSLQHKREQEEKAKAEQEHKELSSKERAELEEEEMYTKKKVLGSKCL